MGPEEDKVVKSVLKSILACVVAMVAGLASAQTFTAFNPPPCDFSDQFYGDNGVDASQTAELNSEPEGRFGTFRQFGPPATTANQANWVADSNCATNDPTRRNFRILATTGAFRDDSGAPTEFFSIIAFVHSQSFFEQTYSRTVGAINGGLGGQQQNPGETISVTNFQNPRGITMQSLVGNFEAYGAPKQTITLNGQKVLAPTPCGTLHDPNVATNDCFSLKDTTVNGSTLSGAATPNLRMDWRVASNRNAIDGSDNNCINLMDQNCKHGVLNDSPFGYFCDDLLGMWIVTYFWYSQNAVGGINSTGGAITPTANCNHVLSCISQIYGNSLDGTPILKTGNQLHFIEGVSGTPANVFPGQGVPGACLQDSDLPPASAACGHEGNLDPAGSDGGAVWLVCPVIPDPRNGAIATDAFLDAVRTSSGAFLDSVLANNFTCLRQTGKFCNESAPGQ
jgi:hypothetical protein